MVTKVHSPQVLIKELTRPSTPSYSLRCFVRIVQLAILTKQTFYWIEINTQEMYLSSNATKVVGHDIVTDTWTKSEYNRSLNREQLVIKVLMVWVNWRTGERRISTDKEWKADILFNVFFCDWSRHAESERRVPIGDFVPFHSVICKCSQNIIPTGTLGPAPRKYLLKLIGFLTCCWL